MLEVRQGWWQQLLVLSRHTIYPITLPKCPQGHERPTTSRDTRTAAATDSQASKKPANEIGKVYCLCRGPDDGTEMFQVSVRLLTSCTIR